MVSACLFGALLEGEGSIIKSYLPDGFFAAFDNGSINGSDRLVHFLFTLYRAQWITN